MPYAILALVLLGLFIPVVPVWYDGILIRRDGIFKLEFVPRWQRKDNLGAKLDVQTYALSLRWPFLLTLQLHLTRYGIGGFLQEHTDVVGLGKLFRIQVILRNAKKGGELLCEHFVVNRLHFKIFEPGKYKHSVTKVEEGSRLLLNFGIWIAQRPPKFISERG